MFNNKADDGRKNCCGRNIALLRKRMGISQRELADRLQLLGLDLDKNAVQRMESGQRFIIDIELKALSRLFEIPADVLLTEGSLQLEEQNSRTD